MPECSEGKRFSRCKILCGAQSFPGASFVPRRKRWGRVKYKLNSQTNYLPVEPIEIETNNSSKQIVSFEDIGYSINDIQKLIYDHPNHNTELLSMVFNITNNTLKNYSSVEIKTYQKDIEKIIKDTLNIKVKAYGITITSVKFKSL